jgi:hypothetical protein
MSIKVSALGDEPQGADENSDDEISADIVAEHESIAAQLRRRREASYRLPPLADGHRDPLDGLAGGDR